MSEELADVLERAAAALRWLERYDEANAMTLLARLVRAEALINLDELEAYVQQVEKPEARP